MAGWESVDFVADRCESLEFGGKVDGTGCFRRAADIERGNANRIAGGDCSVLLLVVEDEGEHAI